MKIKIIVIGIFTWLLFFVGFASASFLQDEAGISASTHVASVNLAQAETAFKNIEKKTASYIIGSIAIDGYDESYDVHVYIDVSGDMVAYYLKSEPASKIIDWINFSGGSMTLEGCKLEDALSKVCNAMFQSLPAVTYFDFRFPNAQIIKVITDEEFENDTLETFNIMIPSGHVIYNITWSHALYDWQYTTRENYFALNGNYLIYNTDQLDDGWHFWEGEITPSSLPVGTYHEFSIKNDQPSNSYGGIVIIYSEAQ